MSEHSIRRAARHSEPESPREIAWFVGYSKDEAENLACEKSGAALRDGA